MITKTILFVQMLSIDISHLKFAKFEIKSNDLTKNVDEIDIR